MIARASATDFTLSSISPVINVNLRRPVDAESEHDEDPGEGRDLDGELEHPLGQVAVDQVLAGVELEVDSMITFWLYFSYDVM